MTPGALVLASLAGALDLSDRTEFRLRLPGMSETGAVAPGKGSLDLETDPDVTLTLSSRTTRYVLEYAPQVVGWNMNLGLQPAVFNTGTARAEWHGRQLRLSLRETASYGLRSFASLTLPSETDMQTGGGRAVTALATTRILYDSSTTLAEVELSLRRWTFAASGGYQIAGGATAADRETVPGQSGPIGNATADHALTRTDHLITTASASAPMTTTTGSIQTDTVLAQVDQAWRHDWSRSTYTLLRGGWSGGESNGPDSTGGFETNAVAEAMVSTALQDRKQFATITLDASLRPTVNPLLGTIDERVQGTVAALYSYGRVGLRGQATFSESVQTTNPSAIRLFFGEVVSSYRLSRALLLEFGSRAFWQMPTGESPPRSGQGSQASAFPLLVTFQQEVAFLSLTVRLDPVRF